MTDLLSRIRSKQALVGIIGQGYVGPAARARLRRGGLPGHRLRPRPDEGRRAQPGRVVHQAHRRRAGGGGSRRRGRFRATTDFDGLPTCDAILICVPTPLGKHREPDMSYIQRRRARPSPTRLRPGQLVVLESTTYPGTTDEEVLPVLEASGPEVARRTSSSPSRPSARTRATRTSTPRSSPRSSAA